MSANPYHSRCRLCAARGTRHMRQWWQRRSLRLRLTLWYAFTSTIILVALGGMLFFVMHGRLLSEMDRHLRGDFELVESSVSRDETGDFSRPSYGDDEDAAEREKQAGPWFEILSPSGSTLLREGPSSDWKVLSPVRHFDAGFGAFSCHAASRKTTYPAMASSDPLD